MKRIVFLSIIIFAGLQGASVRLFNESSDSLTALIYSADGTLLGEELVAPGHEKKWREKRQEMIISQGPAKSITPLYVHWVSADGEVFSLCDGVSTGSLVLSSKNSGKKLRQQKE